MKLCANSNGYCYVRLLFVRPGAFVPITEDEHTEMMAGRLRFWWE
jgi:hypothetical protein